MRKEMYVSNIFSGHPEKAHESDILSSVVGSKIYPFLGITLRQTTYFCTTTKKCKLRL